jgi:hypothetical protein
MIWSAKVISLARRGMEFGLKTESLSVDMAAVQRRKREVVQELRKIHEEHTEASGGELTYGVARFVTPSTVEIELRDGRTRTVQGERVFLDLGSRAAFPQLPGLSVNAGAEVIATTRKGNSFEKLESLGARRVEVEGPDLSSRISARKGSTQFLISWATARSWIPLPCFAEAVVHAWQAFSAVSLRYPTSTLCFRCRAAFTSASSAALFSAYPGSHYLTCRCRPPQMMSLLDVTRQNRYVYFASRKSAKRTS